MSLSPQVIAMGLATPGPSEDAIQMLSDHAQRPEENPVHGGPGGVGEQFGGPRDRKDYRSAVENFIGTVQVPVGLTAPLRIRGRFANGAYHIPLATTEATLVASYSRGAKAINEAGGCVAALLDESIGRAPGFIFTDLHEACLFGDWATTHIADIRRVAESTTNHGRLIDLEATVEGNHVYLHLSFVTGKAAGQNMVTIATEAVLAFIEKAAPVRPLRAFVEGNGSGDKKACMRSFTSVRGKRVCAEVVLPAVVVEERLRVTSEQLAEFWRLSVLGSVLSGTVGLQGHFANGLAALYIACGQDAACVAESATGVTRMEVTADGDLYAAVTLPNLIVGTVGGGTGLPGQRACLDIMGLAGPDSARALAEICGGLCLAGELSLGAAVCAGHFTRAHRLLGRRETRQSARHCNGN